MPRCTECALPVKQLVRNEQGVQIAERCVNCHAPCDPYNEFSGVQNCLDVFLLRPTAWSHVVHNLAGSWKALVPILFLAIVSEAYTSTAITTYGQLLNFPRAVASGDETTVNGIDTPLDLLPPTLKLVTNFASRGGDLISTVTIAEAAVYGLLEYIVVTLVTMWAGSWLTVEIDPANGALRTWFAATSLLWSVKCIFVLFMIWDVPLYLVVCADVISLLWLVRCVRTVAPRSTWTSSIVVCSFAVASRFAFRSATQCYPLYLSADLVSSYIS